jgi:hypothetical protein
MPRGKPDAFDLLTGPPAFAGDDMQVGAIIAK